MEEKDLPGGKYDPKEHWVTISIIRNKTESKVQLKVHQGQKKIYFIIEKKQ